MPTKSTAVIHSIFGNAYTEETLATEQGQHTSITSVATPLSVHEMDMAMWDALNNNPHFFPVTSCFTRGQRLGKR